MSEPSETRPVLPTTFIIKSRIRALINARGKMASASFMAFLDQEVREMVDQACHMVGSRKLIKAGEFRDYRTLIKSYGGGRKK